jgi:hypothetical protein
MNTVSGQSVTTAKTLNGLWAWQIVPCTLAVVAGPIITFVYRLARSPNAETGSLSLAQALRGVLCIAMFASLFRVGRLRLLEHFLIRPLTYLSIYAALTSILSSYPYENLVFAVRLVFLALVFASAFHFAEQGLCSEGWLTMSGWAVLITMAVSQAFGLIGGRTVSAYESAYATAGIIDQAAVTSAHILSTLPVFLRFFPNCGHAISGVILLLVVLFFTMRRTDIIAAAVCIVLILLYNFKPWRRVHSGKFVCTLVLLAALAFAVLHSAPGADLVARFKDLDPSEGTGSGRYSFWGIALEHMLERPFWANILGEGMGSVRDVMSRRFGNTIGCHNDWLDITYAFGIIGLAGLGWWYLTLASFTINLYAAAYPAFPGVLSALAVLGLISVGTGGAFDPTFVMIYAALGFWAGTVQFSGGADYAGCTSL